MSTTGPAPTGQEPPTVVLVPGLGLDQRAWTGVCEALDGDASIVRLPGLGLPAPPGTDLGVPVQAERLARDLARRPGRFVLAGHSASCAVVVAAARRCDRVAGLVLVGPVTDPRGVTWPRLVARWLRTARHERAWEVRALVPQYRRAGVRTILRAMHVTRRYRTDRALAGLDLPVVVLRGGGDRIAPRHFVSRLARGPRRRARDVQGAAHMVPLTHPDAVAGAVRQVVRAAAGR